MKKIWNELTKNRGKWIDDAWWLPFIIGAPCVGCGIYFLNRIING